MNFLAHAYLSFGQPEILVGNMISDFVKGKKQFDYPAGIQAGITLHRAIDQFTDDHPATRAAKKIFQPYYRLYSAAFVDVVYDHFLANDVEEFTESSLHAFSLEVYEVLNHHNGSLPQTFAGIFPYMKQHNWLFHYRVKKGIENSFGGVVRRSLYLTDYNTAYRLFEEHYDELQQYYRQFFPAVKEFAKKMMRDAGNTTNFK